MDFTALYQNIDLSHALKEITDFMKDKISNFSPHITNIIAFHSILDLIFKHNIFKFVDCYCLQIKGVAMSSKCATVFLDLEISLDKLTNNLKFKVHFEKTNTFSYLLSISNHSNFIIKTSE